MICYLCCSNRELFYPEASLFDKILPTIVASSIVVLLFILGRRLDNSIRYEEVKRNWYLKVVIDPNISKVEEFYKYILASINSSISILVDLKSTESFDNYLLDKTKEIGKFQTIKRRFELEFIALVKTNYPEVSIEIEEILRNLEDKVTTCLDNDHLSTEHFSKLESELSSTKYDLYRILYKPFAVKKLTTK